MCALFSAVTGMRQGDLSLVELEEMARLCEGIASEAASPRVPASRAAAYIYRLRHRGLELQRLAAWLRRYRPAGLEQDTPGKMACGEWAMSTAGDWCEYRGQRVHLPPIEMLILRCLIRAGTAWQPRRSLIHAVWGHDAEMWQDYNKLAVAMSRIGTACGAGHTWYERVRGYTYGDGAVRLACKNAVE